MGRVRTKTVMKFSRRYYSRIASSFPNVFLYSALISAYASRPDPDSPAALRLFAAMLRGAPAPTIPIHDFAVVRSAPLDSYSRFSDTNAARCLFDEMPQRNVVSWTALLTGYMRTGQMGKALFMFEEMAERDVPAWNAVIYGRTQNGLFLEALSFFSRMVADRTLPNKTTASCLFSAYAHLGMLWLGKSLHGHAFKNSMGDSPGVCNAVIDMYGKWTRGSHKSLAIETLREMEQEGPQPDQVTFIGLLNACTHAGLVDEGLDYFNSMTRDYTIDPEIEHYGCVIDLLSRASRFDVAMVIVRDIRIEPDEVVWGSLLNGARVHGAKD
ncbi:hypothetical protein ZIOFF_057041 [Zingiber officinale]|uniref:Pentatricopeptide repeat-containing protein n=1 Tax=Zingiber officinale TaxID=94328 RepID=A0A8J5KFS1_ZINOF|nr:hypothetical protein ZIOFF_057041 [Zingiber officinale]